MLLRRLSVFAAAPVLAAGALLAGGTAAAAATTLTAQATGAQEVPKPGPAGATGAGTFTVDSASGKICYQISTSGLTNTVAAHIHKGAAGVAGPVVVPLDASKINSGASTCTSASPSVAADILANPAGFYFNVHTPQFSAGAVRGQLAAGGPSGSNAGSGGAAADSSPRGLLVLAVLAGVVLVGLSGRRLARR